MGELTILCNTRVDIPREISSYWKRKDLWQEKKFQWNSSELERMVTHNCCIIRVHWNIYVLFWLLNNPEQIPEKLKGRNLVFEGTIFTDADGYAYPALLWDICQKKWGWFLYQEITEDQKVRRSYKNLDIRYETNRRRSEENNQMRSRVVSFVKLVRT